MQADILDMDLMEGSPTLVTVSDDGEVRLEPTSSLKCCTCDLLTALPRSLNYSISKTVKVGKIGSFFIKGLYNAKSMQYMHVAQK
jgi:hypothetical protein